MSDGPVAVQELIDSIMARLQRGAAEQPGVIPDEQLAELERAANEVEFLNHRQRFRRVGAETE